MVERAHHRLARRRAEPGAGLVADSRLIANTRSTTRQPSGVSHKVRRAGRSVQAALDEPFLVQAVEQAHQRDRLDVEQGRDRGLAQPSLRATDNKARACGG